MARLTIVAPIRNFGIRVTSATHTAPSTNQSPPFTIRTTPTTNKKYIKKVSMFSSKYFVNWHKKSVHGTTVPYTKRLHAQ